MKSAVKLLLPTLAALALAGCGADLAPKPTALWQSMPSPDPEPMVESLWRLADKGDGLVRVETVESLPVSNKGDLTSVHHDKRYENARSVLVTLAFACDAQRGVAESRVLTSDRMAEGDRDGPRGAALWRRLHSVCRRQGGSRLGAGPQGARARRRRT